MKDNLSRVLLCLAALNLNDGELRQLVSQLRSMRLEEIDAQIANIRRTVQGFEKGQDKPRSSSTKLPALFHDASVGERVERLLKTEAGLTTAQAVENLSSCFVECGFVKRKDLPPLSRTSLRVWVDRMTRRVSGKDILRCATIIRNEHVHIPISDWVLRGTKK
jgi:hypothetical protein